jgi:hemoglobin
VSDTPSDEQPRNDTQPRNETEEATHQVTVFAAVGGQPFFDRLVERFYDHVAADPVLLQLYPDQVDLGPARERLALFLGQYWGGPDTYSRERGHPRLRMRHAPFVIDPVAGEHWLAAMLDALATTMPETPLDAELAQVVRERMTEYFTLSAAHMVNAPGA